MSVLFLFIIEGIINLFACLISHLIRSAGLFFVAIVWLRDIVSGWLVYISVIHCKSLLFRALDRSNKLKSCQKLSLLVIACDIIALSDLV
jgi:hypothetical protein